MATEVRASDSGSFDRDVLGAERPVLVDFHAEWCGPCKAIAPALDALARRYATRVDVRKVNVDENPALARRFGIRSIPTLILFKDGEAAESVIGAASGSRLASLIDAHIGDT